MSYATCYPRPQLKRDSFFPLSEGWTLNDLPICVPFPPQSENAHFAGEIGENLHYAVSFSLPKHFLRDRVILHFGACDQTCTVSLNGKAVGTHAGGYLPFSFDITDLLAETNTLVVDAMDVGGEFYPYGKQCKKPHGMWYTPVSGIWQTVWLEAVSEDYIEAVKFTPTLSDVTVAVTSAAPTWQITVALPNGERLTHVCDKDTCTLTIPAEARRLWSPADPYLYKVTLTTARDRVESYFALRTVSVRQVNGFARICLNDTPILLHGVLDQGYFKDGIFLPTDPAEYEADILRMRELGFHCLRKHIKIEPAIFYEACDRLGMLVWQDHVNNGHYSFFTQTALPTIGCKRKRDKVRKLSAGQQFFLAHAKEAQAHLHSFPCIIGYTIFNEGWGQFSADDAYALLRADDPTRLYDATSGWFAQKHSDLQSEHIYFRSKLLRATEGRPLFLSECGGYTRTIAGHADASKTYGYGSADSEEALTDRICSMLRDMVIASIPQGLCGYVYTQLSDVEGERNGLYTYDRQLCKVNGDRIRAVLAEADAVFSATL